MPARVRTIVTHVNEDGSSGMAEHTAERIDSVDDLGRPTLAANLLWGTTNGTARVGSGDRPGAALDPFFPGPGGHRFLLFTFLPDESAPAEDTSAPRSEGESLPGLLEAFDQDRPGMHRTDTVDYTYVISGELILELEEGAVELQAGDCVVQRGTRHAWRNPSDQPAVVAAVLIGAEPGGPGEPSNGASH